MDKLKEKLEKSIGPAGWEVLKPHFERNAIILVSDQLDLIAAGEAIAKDNTEQVQKWIDEKLMTRPTEEQVNSWEMTPDREFQSLIVQPYVLVQIGLS